MARKSSGPGAGLILLGVVVAGLMAIPKAVWIAFGVVAVLGLLVYFFIRYLKNRDLEDPATEVQPESQSDGLAGFALPADWPSTKAAPKSPQSALPARMPLETPTTVKSASPPPADYRIPKAPQGYGVGQWIPAGQSVEVAGLTLPGGMLYVGTKLPAGFGANDPCLIDPSKSVARSGDFTERQMNYWPSYAEISPEARRAYLNWLASGRQDPEADIGFVFLFFYGLERRAIFDASKNEEAQADWPVIAQELRRLLTIYGEKSSSFRRYAGELLDWVALAEHPSKLYEIPVPEFPRTMELPLYIRLALGQAAVDGVPVPSHLALAWARSDPNQALRTPAIRCPDEFAKLFSQKYAEAFGAGMVLPRNRTKLKLVYRPASSGFRGYGDIKLTFNDTPDVTVLTGPARKLQEIVEAATKPLEAYSRAVGKDASAKTSLEALLQLPATLWPESVQKALADIKGRMGDGMVVMSFQNVLDVLGARSTLTRDKTGQLFRTLESLNIGVEPDVLAGAKPPKPDETVVLFAMPPSEPVSRTTGAYLAAALTLQLASAVAVVDGEFGIKELAHLREAVLSWTHLTPSQIRRLLAHLRLLMQAPASLTVLKKKFEPLDMTTKEAVAAFMATVAQSDGEVSPAEVKMLEKVYKALGVDSKRVFSDVHAVAAGTKPSTATAAKDENTGFKLDPARIAALQKDTEKVSALLANIFVEPEDGGPQVAVEPTEVEPDVSESPSALGLLGLDEAHSSLARMLLSRPEWSREELQDIAADLDLMLDGALELINEAALDHHDMPLFEGDDPLSVNAEILEKVEA